MKSMTGFGFSDFQDERLHASLAIKSYNNRFLDIYVTLPPYLDTLEPKIRELLIQRIQRGRVEVSLKLLELEAQPLVRLDRSAVRAYVGVLRELADVSGLEERLELSHLLSIEGLIKTEQSRDLDAYWLIVEPLLENAFRSYEQTRQREGEATREDVVRLLATIEREMETIQRYAPDLEQRIVQELRTRFRELLGEGVEESRVYAEAAVILLKANVNEEIMRLRSHMGSFHQVLQEKGPVGKKLDFLCQELNREINTIGSKSMVLEVSTAVINVKDAIEKIREQLRNVE
jgi:uncharacterized protein (TIGR00255 family)